MGPEAAARPLPPPVSHAISVIEQRYAEGLTLRAIAYAVDRDRAHLARVFKHFTGQTVHSYVARVRVTKAVALLAAGQKVEAAMLQVGYRSKKNFYRQFRLITGKTPGACRHRPAPSR